MKIIENISANIKIFLTLLSLIAMSIGIAGIWGYAGPETVGKAIGTMALVGGTVILIDGLIYNKSKPSGSTPLKKTKDE